MSHDDYVGKTEHRTDAVSPAMLERMAATLGLAVPETLPPLWHWTLFQEWQPPPGLGPDGHPKRGGFLPPVHHLPRRMWAGGRLEWHRPLHPGDAVTRTSTIRAVTEKQGGSGTLVFVTVAHEIAGPEGLAIAEEQDIVYRGADTVAVKPGEPAADRLPSDAKLRAELVPDPVTLFRYSALTGNGHRIHYDSDYVRDVERYPGLVVHGPLQATWLAGLLAGRPIKRFGFRGQRPAFSGRRLVLEGRESAGSVRLRTLDESGAVCMAGDAVLAA